MEGRGPEILRQVARRQRLLTSWEHRRVTGLLSGGWGLGFTHRPLSSSFLGLPFRILNIIHKQELLRGL